MSNPYGPYGNDPYGQQPPANPYGPPAGGSGFNEPVKTDGVSVASLVLSLLCCTGLIGMILGFVGLSRTKGGQRKGRGFAIAGIVLGLLATIGGIVAGVVIFVFAESVVTPENAEVGQCVNVDEEDDTVFLREAECNEEHDAEIVGVAEVTDENLERVETEMTDYCAEIISDEDAAKLAEYLADIKAVTQDPNDVEVGDDLVCYVDPAEKLDEQIL